ncbi:hypothetical protein [Arthrobacter sp. JSM 101049]|uniref:hypothetical protein n=1 Tax=Arthrobacter sp. JSM 101049 TaxID=929097 RepID=UPI003561385C
MTSLDLLAGPRGRRFCLAAVTGLSDDLWSLSLRSAWDPGNASLRAELCAAIGSHEVLRSISEAPDAALLTALADAVDRAAYWQPPDETDGLAAIPAMLTALGPVADILSGRIAGSWWSSGIGAGSQRAVQWIDESDMPAPQLSGATGRVADWHRRTVESERAASRWTRSLKKRPGSSWWSTPALSQLVHTTRSLPGLGAAGLLLVEDGAGWDRARVWPLAPVPSARILEIRGPADWVDLVERHPLEVTQTWRKTAWETTGIDGTWLIPDFAAVAREYDGVHLTVAGYLTTAGRPLDAGNGRTILAGWDPDATYWLADVLRPAGDPVEWTNPVVGTTPEWSPTAR